MLLFSATCKKMYSLQSVESEFVLKLRIQKKASLQEGRLEAHGLSSQLRTCTMHARHMLWTVNYWGKQLPGWQRGWLDSIWISCITFAWPPLPPLNLSPLPSPSPSTFFFFFALHSPWLLEICSLLLNQPKQHILTETCCAPLWRWLLLFFLVLVLSLPWHFS